MSFYQWLQFAMVPRLNRLAAGESYFPKQSDTAVYAAGELGEVPGAARLHEILADHDSFINDLSSYAPDWYRIEAAGKGEVEPESEEEPKDAGVREHVELYWQTRALDCEASTAFEPEWPLPGATEMLARPSASSTRTVVGGTAPFDRTHDAPLPELAADPPAPYVHDADARGRAMRFWPRLGQNRLKRAREVFPPESRGVKLETFSQGHIDELYCYLDHEEEGDVAEVRVMMNTLSEQRIWRTKMFRRVGVWFIDHPATLEASR